MNLAQKIQNAIAAEGRHMVPDASLIEHVLEHADKLRPAHDAEEAERVKNDASAARKAAQAKTEQDAREKAERDAAEKATADKLLAEQPASPRAAKTKTAAKPGKPARG